MQDLAIVIPAYKPDFLLKTLTSIYSQSCKDFNLYIGDDCSPYGLSDIVHQFKDERIHLIYKRFTTNLGGKDLVAQWERCLALTQGEEWIWLFSDDDVMGERCVESFYKQLENDKTRHDLYHFNVRVIDAYEHMLKESVYPDIISARNFYRLKAMAQIESFVVENIFSRKIYEQVGGFSKFPLAWGSDTFTWMQMMKDKGMKTISGDFVYWRASDVNITPNKDRKVSVVKALADVELIYRAEVLLGKSIRRFNMEYFFRMVVHYCKDIGFIGFIDMVHKAKQRNILNKVSAWGVYVFYPVFRLIKFIR